MSRQPMWFVLAMAINSCGFAVHAEDVPATFIVGADISWVPQQEAGGIRWTDNGTPQDILAILQHHGFNWIRLRIFVHPAAEGGYSKQGYCDLQHTMQMARRVKAAGMHWLLDFHYSDTWADPGHQAKPAAWRELHGDGLRQAITEHTREVLGALQRQGTLPDIVQVGNEISHGLLWPDGKVWQTKDWNTFSDLVKAGISGVRQIDPSIRIMIHLACGGDNAKSRVFLDRLLSHDVEFDVIGQSYYPRWHGTLDDLRSNVRDLAIRYQQPIIVVEYSRPNIRQINDIVHGLPKDTGLGTFIWEPTKWRGGVLFDAEGKTRPAIDIYTRMARDYGNAEPATEVRHGHQPMSRHPDAARPPAPGSR